jgi:5-formyltetrahydrofolate cyclo-ligase
LHFLRADDPILISRGNATPYEPVTCDAVEVRDIDLFLIPGLAYDRSGNRIGQGGGYFDRFLYSARSDAAKIGLAFDVQIVEPFKPDSWDVPVDWIATESGLMRVGTE